MELLASLLLLDFFPLDMHDVLRLYRVSFIEISLKYFHHSEYISRDAEGSGVPEMKGVLAGVYLPNLLSVRAFIGKWVGIVVGLCAGLSFGRQGAFVHTTCIWCH